MKKLLLFFTVLVMGIFLFTACGGTSDSGETTANPDNDDQTFVIGVDDQFPPLGYRDESGEIVGFDIDLAKIAAEKLGMDLRVQQIDWAAKELELEQGNIDAIWNGLTITPEREEVMLFTDPYLENEQVVVVPKDSEIKTVSDLALKKVGLQSGSSAEDALTGNPISDQVQEIVTYDDNVAALQDLSIGRTDAVVVDLVVANWYIKENNSDYVVLEEALAPEKYGVAVAKDNTELQEKLNAVLDEIKSDGSGEEASIQWFGSNILYSES